MNKKEYEKDEYETMNDDDYKSSILSHLNDNEIP